MSRYSYFRKLGLMLVVLVSLLIGWQLGFRGYLFSISPWQIRVINREPPSKVSEVVDFSTFWDVIELLGDKYYDSTALNGKELLYGAIRGAVESLGDPYTVFYTPEENEEFKLSLDGIYEGIGAQLGYEDNQLVVISPLHGSPAEAAGIKGGDAILEVEGESTQDWPLAEAVSKIRGSQGSTVSLKLGRGEENSENWQVIEMVLEREEIQVPSLVLGWEGDEVAVVKAFRFGEDTRARWEEVVVEMKEKGVSGMVLDLRNNPGGYLEGALIVASEFFKDGEVVLKKTAAGKIDGLGLDHKGQLTELPVVVLINGGSASSSEIIAGAIQSRGRGQLVGKKSFGKGTVQEAIDLDGGAGLHITIADWLLPSGESIHDQGLMPDFVVEPDDDEDSKTDAQMEKALELLNK